MKKTFKFEGVEYLSKADIHRTFFPKKTYDYALLAINKGCASVDEVIAFYRVRDKQIKENKGKSTFNKMGAR